MPNHQAKTIETQPWRQRAVIGISLLLAVVLTLSGFIKLIGLPMVVEQFESWLYPRWFVHFAGALELLAAGLIAYPRTRQFGAWLVMAVMFGAIITHLKYDYSWTDVAPAILLFAGAWYVNWELKKRAGKRDGHRRSGATTANGSAVN
jgi:uncharacterized membrane protein YphA (DoxX/SURF4 family)